MPRPSRSSQDARVFVAVTRGVGVALVALGLLVTATPVSSAHVAALASGAAFTAPYTGALDVTAFSNYTTGCGTPSAPSYRVAPVSGIGLLNASVHANSCAGHLTSEELAVQGVGLYLPINVSLVPASIRVQLDVTTHVSWSASLGTCSPGGATGVVCDSDASVGLAESVDILDLTSGAVIAGGSSSYPSAGAGAAAVESCTASGSCNETVTECGTLAGCAVVNGTSALVGSGTFFNRLDLYVLWPRGTLPVAGDSYVLDVNFQLNYLAECDQFGSAVLTGCHPTVSGAARGLVTDFSIS